AGRRADLVVLADVREIAVETAYVGGRRVAANGRMLEAPAERAAPPAVNTMKLAPLSADDFRRRVPGVANGRARLRTIKGARFNSWSEIEVEVRDGFAIVPAHVSVMTVAHRHGRSTLRPQTSIIEGWDRWRGAYASSYSHDSHHLVAYGHDTPEIALA